MQVTFQAIPAVAPALRDLIRCPQLGMTIEVIDTRREPQGIADEADEQTVYFFTPFKENPFEEDAGWYFKLQQPTEGQDISKWSERLFLKAATSYLRDYMNHEPVGFAIDSIIAWYPYQNEPANGKLKEKIAPLSAEEAEALLEQEANQQADKKG